jgi:hypothetical protein
MRNSWITVVSEKEPQQGFDFSIKQNSGRGEFSSVISHVTVMECNYLIILGKKQKKSGA